VGVKHDLSGPYKYSRRKTPAKVMPAHPAAPGLSDELRADQRPRKGADLLLARTKAAVADRVRVPSGPAYPTRGPEVIADGRLAHVGSSDDPTGRGADTCEVCLALVAGTEWSEGLWEAIVEAARLPREEWPTKRMGRSIRIEGEWVSSHDLHRHISKMAGWIAIERSRNTTP
jgi:hypothetical protein